MVIRNFFNKEKMKQINREHVISFHFFKSNFKEKMMFTSGDVLIRGQRPASGNNKNSKHLILQMSNDTFEREQNRF